jgi:hypothetical protein
MSEQRQLKDMLDALHRLVPDVDDPIMLTDDSGCRICIGPDRWVTVLSHQWDVVASVLHGVADLMGV